MSKKHVVLPVSLAALVTLAPLSAFADENQNQSATIEVNATESAAANTEPAVNSPAPTDAAVTSPAPEKAQTAAPSEESNTTTPTANTATPAEAASSVVVKTSAEIKANPTKETKTEDSNKKELAAVTTAATTTNEKSLTADTSVKTTTTTPKTEIPIPTPPAKDDILPGLTIDSSVTSFSSFQASSNLLKAAGTIKLNGDTKIGDKQLHPVYKFDLTNPGKEKLDALSTTIAFPEGYVLDESFPQLVLITPNNQNPHMENITWKLNDAKNGLILSIPNMDAAESMHFDVKFFLVKPAAEQIINKEVKEKFKLGGNAWFTFKGKTAEFTQDLYIENGNLTAFKDFSLTFKAPDFLKLEKFIWINGIKVNLVQNADGTCVIKLPELLKGKTHFKLRLSGMVVGQAKSFSLPFTLICGKEFILQKSLMVHVKDLNLPDFTAEMKKKIKLNGSAWFMQKGNKAEFYHELFIENSNSTSFKNFILCFSNPASLKLEKFVWINGVRVSLVQNTNGTCTVSLPEILKGKTHLKIKLTGTAAGKMKTFTMPFSLQFNNETICDKSVAVNLESRVNPVFTKEMKQKVKLNGHAWLKVHGKTAEFTPEFRIENYTGITLKNICLVFKAPPSFKIENVIWIGGVKGTITQRADGMYQIMLPELPKGKVLCKLKVVGAIAGELKPITLPVILESDNETVIEQPFTVPLNNSGNPSGGVGPGAGGSADPGTSGETSSDPGSSAGTDTSVNSGTAPVSPNPSSAGRTDGSQTVSRSSTLPITGSAVDSKAIILLGLAAVGAGLYLFRRKGAKN
ncbi:LPXTG cell wall anchor domain-containing protein [Peribacillus deserti]|uniref:Gram-positive cocci surface proteins LPxTG domain-containing protein n=1 Tax=Peribacillus deserti TaxID=673318 RepID=A0A2N5M7H0_9BACI|nr:LPXTG cell wall anchor domain-containing protein [Peribacillus deserti]PLT30285.1 hypothetical protein CUU66_08675 [Peribacillus deserti]